jgi:hypothetical protein
MAETSRVPLASQIAEIGREIRLRQGVYPRQIASGKMRQSEADLCMRRIEAVLETLFFCQTHEADIRAYIAAKREASS